MGHLSLGKLLISSDEQKKLSNIQEIRLVKRDLKHECFLMPTRLGQLVISR